MSTKIFDAYRLPSGADPFAVIGAVRAAMLPVRLQAEAQEVFDTALSLADRYSLHRDTSRLPQASRGQCLYTPDWPTFGAVQVLAEKEKKEPVSSAFHDRFRCTVSLVRDPADGRLLAKAFIGPVPEMHTAFDEFAAASGWEDYHYQDQTDRPDWVSETEWQERRDSWDRTLGDETFVERGLCLDAKPTGRYGTAAQVLGTDEAERHALASVRVPTKEKRLRRLLIDAGMQVLALGSEPSAVMSSYWRVAEAVSQACTSNLETELARVHGIDAATFWQPQADDKPVLTHALTEERLRECASDILREAGIDPPRAKEK